MKKPAPTFGQSFAVTSLAVVPLPGLHLDSLGLCLSALGLLSLCTRRWKSVRGGWRGAAFYLVGGPATETELISYLSDIGERCEWSNYQKGWDKHQKADTKAKGATNVARWRAHEAEEDVLPLLQSHISPSDRLSFNPLFGTGGNAGKRDFATGWVKAKTAIAKPPKGWRRELLNADIAFFLRGDPPLYLADYNAGCWFGAANKAYNSGTARPFRDGQVSPWAMVLACEAFGIFQGGTSRRLGSARRAAGAFPFVAAGVAPKTAGEAGKNLGELWLPVWEQPMSLQEVILLFQRGRAEVNDRAATNAPAFAAAILQRGIDAGIREFRRFLLLRTTSENTFESRLASVVPVSGEADAATSRALAHILDFRDSLPPDRKKGKRWVYAGLRGTVDESLVSYVENFGDESKRSLRAESARATVDAMIDTLRKADQNRGHRAHNPPIRFQLLPATWAISLLDHDGGGACEEARIGLALATLFAGGKNAKSDKEGASTFLPYWLGIKMHGPYCTMPETVPFRRVWSAATLAANFSAVLHRRLIEEEPFAAPPFGAWCRVGIGDIEAWLSGTVDDVEVERWAMRFSLFDWKRDTAQLVEKRLGYARSLDSPSAELALFSLIKPLFQRTLLNVLLSYPQQSKSLAKERPTRIQNQSKRTINEKEKNAKVGPLPGIVAQLACGNISAAVRLARTVYRAVGIEPANLPFQEFACGEPQRLLAALLIPTHPRKLCEDATKDGKIQSPSLASAWISPRKHNSYTS